MLYKPMLCKLGTKKDLKLRGFIFEPKLDGTRLILYKENNKFKGINRRGNSILYRYPELIGAFKKGIKARSCVLDGELVVYNEKGLPDFHLLQQREHITNKLLIELRSQQMPACYVVFDILELNGKKLLDLPLRKRKEILKQVIEENQNLQLCFYTTNGKALWQEVVKLGLEGVVAKKLSSPYLQERSSYWIKIKNLKTIDCVVVGFSSERRELSALCVACYYKGKLFYIGRVNAALPEKEYYELYKELKKLIQKKIPVVNPPSDWRKHNIKWLKPKIVCEVRYLEFTKDKELRFPVLLRIREDKLPKDCILEEQIENAKL